MKEREKSRVPQLGEMKNPIEIAFDPSNFKSEKERMEYLHRSLEGNRENAERKAKFAFRDESGADRGEILFEPFSGDIVEIRIKPWTNTDAAAEKPNEYIYITDAEGKITETCATRKEARDKGLRYMVASTLIFHGKDVLVQRRSAKKKIDPSKRSASAHGVASEIMKPDGGRFKNADNVAAITAALEINEELRHGEGEQPFKILFWCHGKERDLFQYAKHQKLDDPDTIWMVPQALYTDDAYPLGSKKNKRTRAVFTGFIFSEYKPSITHDPGEVSETSWVRASEYASDPHVTEDMQTVTNSIFNSWMENNGVEIAAKKLIHDTFG